MAYHMGAYTICNYNYKRGVLTVQVYNDKERQAHVARKDQLLYTYSTRHTYAPDSYKSSTGRNTEKGKTI